MRHLTYYLFVSLAFISLTRCSGGINAAKGPDNGHIISIKVGKPSNGIIIPDDFSGLSVETGSVRINNTGTPGYIFSDKNTETLRIFRELGIRHLRVGGGSVDINKTAPTLEDIDELFAFAKASGVKVVYSLRLLNGDLKNEVQVARYIWEKYREYLDCFAIGNEPDWNSYHISDPEIKDYPSYLAKWKRFAEAVVAEIPEAKFMGPNTGSNFPVTGAKDTDYNGCSWTLNFAKDLKETGLIAKLAQHNYVGQDVNEKSSPWEMVDKMLSAAWVSKEYPALYHAVVKPALDEGFACRLAESNSFSGQCPGGSNSFATALFALDYMFWWASHQCSGVNFHNKQWVLNAPIGMDSSKKLIVNPIGYGIKAFNFAGKGEILPIKVESCHLENVRAYATLDHDKMYVTLINKEHGHDARTVSVSLSTDLKYTDVETLTLSSPDGDPLSKTALLGGSAIESGKDWAGIWEKHDIQLEKVTLEPSSAKILRFTVKR